MKITMVTMVTTNEAKVVRLRGIFRQHGLEVDWVVPGGMPELQADTSIEVASCKAQWAYDTYRRAVLVDDLAFNVDRLNGWPGVTFKQALEALTPAGLLRLMAPWPNPADRTCRYIDAVVCRFGDGPDDAVVRECVIEGRLALAESDYANTAGMNYSLWSIFIPDGHEVALAAMTDDEVRDWRASSSVLRVYEDLAARLKSRL
jgi:non-canonical purine NTP pyrophosphatase (RdgB/HAM1 family)